MEYCCHVWAGAPSCYSELLDKLQKRTSVGSSLAPCLESFSHLRNLLSFSSELAELVPFPYSQGRSMIGCMIFQSPFLDVTRMTMSRVSFLAQLDSGILCL